jgi:hypothetical protein
VPNSSTRQRKSKEKKKTSFAECQLEALGKEYFFLKKRKKHFSLPSAGS